MGEVVSLLAPQSGGVFVDGTVGGGDHSQALLDVMGLNGRLICIDKDRHALETAQNRLTPAAQKKQVRLDFIHSDFRRIDEILKNLNLAFADGIVADLGVSSMQLDQGERGFSFRKEAPLDMRMDVSQGRTAAQIVAETAESELADMLYYLGGERRSRRIARYIVAERERTPILTTMQLAQLVRRAVGAARCGKVDAATRTFQALRMCVNDELGALAEFIQKAPALLNAEGTLAIIAFHSGEDRLVKKRFKELSQTGRFKVLSKHVLRPSSEERKNNPRSRSARVRGLRVVLP